MENKEKVIDELTEKEIQELTKNTEQMQLEINERMALEVDNIPNHDEFKLQNDLNDIINKYMIKEVAEIGKNELAKFAKEQLDIVNVSFDIDFEDDVMKALKRQLEQQNAQMVDNAIETIKRYTTLYQQELQFQTVEVAKVDVNASIDEITKQAKKLTKTKLNGQFIKEDNVTYFLRSDGTKERATYWVDRNTRSAFQDQHNDYTRQIAEYTGNDLIRVSAHSDCSDLCAPYQAKILSISGNDTRYTSLANAIENGFQHVNCRHSTSLYIDGLSDPDLWDTERLPEKERQELYKKRQQGKYNARQSTKYNDRYKRAKAIGNEQDMNKYKELAKTYREKAEDQGVFVPY